MFWLKGCPRCNGDLHDNSDVYGNYIDCFQCGHYLTADQEARVRDEYPNGTAHILPSDQPVRVLEKIAA
jgi:hypothetical protein